LDSSQVAEYSHSQANAPGDLQAIASSTAHPGLDSKGDPKETRGRPNQELAPVHRQRNQDTGKRQAMATEERAGIGHGLPPGAVPHGCAAGEAVSLRGKRA